MGQYTMETFKNLIIMDKEFLKTKMVINMKDNSQMENIMVKEN